MSYSEKSKNALSEIQTAFKGLSCPKQKKSEATTSNLDLKEMMEEFKGRDWAELDFSQLMFHREALNLLTPQAFQFYLPAYLQASLQPNPYQTDIRDYTLRSLRPLKEDKENRARFEKRISLLTPIQKKAIRSFLDALSADSGSWKQDPAMKYWGIKK